MLEGSISSASTHGAGSQKGKGPTERPKNRALISVRPKVWHREVRYSSGDHVLPEYLLHQYRALSHVVQLDAPW
jgi:hypothetical protein